MKRNLEGEALQDGIDIDIDSYKCVDNAKREPRDQEHACQHCQSPGHFSFLQISPLVQAFHPSCLQFQPNGDARHDDDGRHGGHEGQEEQDMLPTRDEGEKIRDESNRNS